MLRIFRHTLVALALGVSPVAISGSSYAAGDFMSTASAAPMGTTSTDTHDSWYREQQSTKPDVKAIIQQKAQIQAQQRMDRMASMQWYGMSGSRPQTAATPFSSRYGSVWEMPGGKPYSWYPYARPGYVMYWR